MKVTKEQILSEIRRTASENGDVPLGKARFLQETGIAESDWLGRYWARWSDAVRDAGFSSQKMNQRMPDEAILEAAAKIVRRLGHFPTAAEIRLAVRADPALPSHNTYRRFGGMKGLRTALAGHAQHEDDVSLLAILSPHDESPENSEDDGHDGDGVSKTLEEGFVYLLRSGRHFKIGKANSVARRTRELAIQLPEPAEVLHRIRTDDPLGVEAYWHRRFADQRLNGEWFALRPADVKAFKRRRFM